MDTDSRTSPPPDSETEYLVAWISQGLDQPTDICIYGNPAGLRSLARLLLRVADYDQSAGQFPDDESLHCHLRTGWNTEEKNRLPRLTLGRVDSKNDKASVRWPFPPLAGAAGLSAMTEVSLE